MKCKSYISNYVDGHIPCWDEKFKDLLLICRKYLAHDMTKAEFKEVVEQYYSRESV